MDCAAVKPRMEALVNGTLPASEREPAEQHIAMCEGCRLELELVRAIGSQEKAPAVGKDDWTLDRIFGAHGEPGRGGEPPAAGPSGRSPDALSMAPLAPPAAAPSSTASNLPASPFPLEPPGSASEAETAMPESIADPTPFASAMRPTTPPSAPSAPGPAPDAGSSSSEGSMGESNAGPAPARPKRAAPSWDFEPADASTEAKVPEESLFFATEALTRRKEPEAHKGSNFRVLLWGAGGLIGAILLAFSSWFVLHMSSAEDAGKKDEPDFNLEDPEDPGKPPPADGAQPGQPSEEPDQTAQGAPPTGTPGVSPPQPSASSGTAVSPAPPATRQNPPVTRSSTSGMPFPNPPAADQSPGITTTPRTSTGSQRSSGSPSQHGSDAGSRRSTPGAVKPFPRPTRQAPDYGEETHIFGITPSPSQRETNDEDLAPPPSQAPSTTRKTSPPEPVRPAEEKPAGDNPPAPAPPPDTPIQRLHMATVGAEERGDLADLRRLRSAWKEYVSKVVGPDRSRAKREYADCLWAIQGITGKRGDQKDTLAAYRDYLLSAPAGGADNRSASRLRQLEEAFTEKR